MTREGGFSVIELVVASAVLLMVSGAVLGLLHEGLAATPVLEETTDLYQRARSGADALGSDLRAAGAGPPSGPLSRYFAAVDPRTMADAPGTTSGGAVTLRYAPPNGAHARLAQPLPPGVPIVMIDTSGACPSGTTACGFAAGTTAVVFDTAGNAAFVAIESIGPGVLVTRDLGGSRGVTYPAGTEIAEAVQITYRFDLSVKQLRRTDGNVEFPWLDHVISVLFEYFDDGMRRLPLPRFEDGPFVGSGATMFDADLLRVKTVRATIRIETGAETMRGGDTRLFARPGTAAGPRTIPDAVVRIDTGLRNGR